MIRPATPHDLSSVSAIYEAILDQEDSRPRSYTNWQRGKYPCLDTARQALESGTLYVAEENGAVCAAVILNGEQLPEYDLIPWQFQAERSQVMVIHTLVIHPSHAGRGLGRKMVEFCENTARQAGKHAMRLDTYEGNDPANTMYPKLGYRFAGATEFFFQGLIHEVLNCYEKQLF